MNADNEDHKVLYLHLLEETRILFLIYHRNKNQHKRSHWWKRLNILKRHTDQVVRLLSRRRIERVQELARLYHLLNGFLKKQLRKTYLDFTSIIGLGQFVTLGVVLVGILARVHAVYRKLLEYYDFQFKEASFIRIPGEKPLEAREFMESLVEQELDETLLLRPVKPASPESQIEKSKPKKKVSKKKKRSAIDDIFG